MKIYVGNLPFRPTESEVRALFLPYGEVQSVEIFQDLEEAKFWAYGFVEMEDEAATKAIAALDRIRLRGRPLAVNKKVDR